MSNNPGKVIITPRPPVGGGGHNQDDGSGNVLKSAMPKMEEIVKDAVSHEEALAPDTKLPPVAAKKACAVKKEALDAPQKKRCCKKKAK